MCCACGGGSTEGNDEEEDGNNPDDDVVPPVPTPDDDDGTIDPTEEANMIFDMFDVALSTTGSADGKLCLEEFQLFFTTYCTVCPW